MRPCTVTDTRTDWENKQSCHVTIQYFQGNPASSDGCPDMGYPNRLAANVWLCRCSCRFVSLFGTYGQNHGVGLIYTDSFGNLNDQEGSVMHHDEQNSEYRLQWSNL